MRSFMGNTEMRSSYPQGDYNWALMGEYSIRMGEIELGYFSQKRDSVSKGKLQLFTMEMHVGHG